MIDVSNIGPFSNGQHIHFKNQLTIILGPNGSGKTTIRKKLESNLLESAKSSFSLDFLSFLIFSTEESLLPAAANFEDFLTAYEIDPGDLDAQITKILENLNVKIPYSKLLDKNYTFAMGERVIVNIIKNIAIRKMLLLDIPFVIDETANFLDLLHLELLVYILRQNCSQIIIFTYPESGFKQIGLNSDYYIQFDNKTNESIILKTNT
jgi:ABC-type Na+ transport system ATPase subunit NatA